MKKTVYFLAPKNKWWTYFYYKKITEYLIKNYNKEYNIIFCNSLFDYIKLHFIKTDITFSIIPFFFKPLCSKKYIFNLHWNYKVERKNKWLWVKLLYLTELNLWFSDKIMLTSYYLADKLWFRKKYNKKIEILPNFIEKTEKKNIASKKNKYNFLTITSFKFLKKWKWVINLWKIIKEIWELNPNKKVIFSIIWNEKNKNWEKIHQEFNTIKFPKNTRIIWKWWLNKKQIKKEFLKHNTFLYWSELDNTPGVILEALNYNLKVLVNNFESFSYFLPHECICKNEKEMIKKINNKKEYTAKIYYLEDIIKKILNNFIL